MLRVAATALLCISASLASDPSSFDAYVQRFGKSYSSDVERDARRFIFQNNIREISRLNAAAITAGSSHHPAVFEVNEFADLTPEEFQTKRGMSKALCSTAALVPGELFDVLSFFSLAAPSLAASANIPFIASATARFRSRFRASAAAGSGGGGELERHSGRAEPKC